MSQEELKKRLRVLMNKPENQVCSDCPERQPRWASLIVPPPGSPPGSLPIGAFCCLECSGSHRRLGVHISFVRSINLDSWKEKEVRAMENGGNKKVNLIFEGKLKNFGSLNTKPSAGADGRTRERFIRDKYERRKYFDASALQKAEEESSSSEEESEEEEVVVKKKSGKVVPIRAPSDAARQRAESRKARLNAYRAKETNPSVAIPKKQPAPQPAQEVDLLGFDVTTPAAPPPADPAASSIDLFAQINISSNNTATSSQVTITSTQTQPPAQTPPQAQPQEQPAQPKKYNTDEILSMFNTPAPNNYYQNTPSNAISNMNTMNPYMQQQTMQQHTMQTMPQQQMQQQNMPQQGYNYPMMMQQTTIQQSNPQFQFQAYNMTNNYMGGTTSSSTQMYMKSQQQQGKLDSNGFPMF